MLGDIRYLSMYGVFALTVTDDTICLSRPWPVEQDADSLFTVERPAGITGTYTGLGTGGTNGAVYFGDFYTAANPGDCPGCDDSCACGHIDGLSPWEMEAVVDGIVDNVPDNCAVQGDCNDLNRTYIADCYLLGSAFDCSWRFHFHSSTFPHTCLVGFLEVGLSREGSNYWLYGRLVQPSTSGADDTVHLEFKKDLGTTKPTAASINSENLTLVYENPNFTCDGSAATFAVTAR